MCEIAQDRAAFREMNDGFQVVKVVEDKSDASDMVVSFPGRHLEQMEDGRVIIRRGGECGEPVGVIDPAWAKGADGAVMAVVPDFTASKALAAACGVLSAVVGGAASEGRCVSVKFIPLSPIKVVSWLTRCYA